MVSDFAAVNTFREECITLAINTFRKEPARFSGVIAEVPVDVPAKTVLRVAFE